MRKAQISLKKHLKQKKYTELGVWFYGEGYLPPGEVFTLTGEGSLHTPALGEVKNITGSHDRLACSGTRVTRCSIRGTKRPLNLHMLLLHHSYTVRRSAIIITGYIVTLLNFCCYLLQ